MDCTYSGQSSARSSPGRGRQTPRTAVPGSTSRTAAVEEVPVYVQPCIVPKYMKRRGASGTGTYADGARLLRARVEDDERDVVHHVALVRRDVSLAPVDSCEHLVRCTAAATLQC